MEAPPQGGGEDLEGVWPGGNGFASQTMIETVPEKFLTLLAITSLKRVGDRQVLSFALHVWSLHLSH